MRHGKKIIFLLICLPLKLWSQDITGLWQGLLYNDTTKQYYRYEIGISQDKKGKLSGYSHTWFLLDDFQFYGVKKLKIRKADDGKIIIEDDGLIANNYPVSPAKHVRQLNVLSFSANDSEMMLSGPFSTNRTKQFKSLTGSVEVKRKINFRQSALIPHLQELGLDNQLSFVKEENEMLAALEQKKITEQVHAKKDSVAAIALAEKENQRIAAASTLKNGKPLLSPEVKTIVAPASIAAKENEKGAADTKAVAPEKISTKPAEPTLTAATIKAEKQRKADSTIAANKIQKQADQEKAAIATAIAAKEKAQKQKTADSLLVVARLQKAADQEKLAVAVAKENKAKEPVIEKQTVKKQDPIVVDKKTTIADKPGTELKPAEINAAGKTTALNTIPVSKNMYSPAAEVEKRSTVLQQTVYFKTDSLQLALYDNGEVDGDTVSILMNGELIMGKQRLSTNAIRKTIYIDPNADSIQLVMYAENLGTIAPNTGLLVVRDGKDLYEIRFSGDLQKNAAIVFRRKKE